VLGGGLVTVGADRRSWAERVGHPVADDVPVPSPSISLALKQTLDEAILWGMARLSPRTALAEPARRELDRALDFHERRGWLDRPDEFHRSPPDLDRPSFSAAKIGQTHYEHMTFESGYKPDPEDPALEQWLGFQNNQTAHAWVKRHPQAERPWLICVHGYGMGSALADLGAFRVDSLHRGHGLNLVSYVAPLHGPRASSGYRGGEYFTNLHATPVHAAAQALWDLRRILGWVRRQGATQVGVYGLSLCVDRLSPRRLRRTPRLCGLRDPRSRAAGTLPASHPCRRATRRRFLGRR